MIDLDKENLFLESMDTLKNTSAVDAHKEYLSNSNLNVINFDKVKDSYCSILKYYSKAKLHSNDALYIDKSKSKFIFIEFKNGKLEGKGLKDVQLKISESLLMFNDIINENLSFDRENVNYILVYNKEKNLVFEAQRTSSLSKFNNLLAKNAGKRFCINGFDRYFYFFHDVKTINQEEFKEIELKLQNNAYEF